MATMKSTCTADYTNIGKIVIEDVKCLKIAGESYGDSWKKRGGVGAFMMAARKFDRLDQRAEQYEYDIFTAACADDRPEGVLDDIRDLRRYLLLIEDEIARRITSGPAK